MLRDCERFLISGRVQGVGFRYHTCHEGLRLSLQGYAKNMNSGQVEVMAVGEPTQLDVFAEWLSHGPRTATVTSVTREKVAMQTFQGFEIL